MLDHRVLHGSQNELSLSDLIQIGAANRRTLRARVRGAAIGEVFLERGELRHATYGDLVGCEAIYAMLAEDDARYECESDVSAPETTVYAPVAHVLLEAARRMDEGTVARPTPTPRAPTQAPAIRLPTEPPRTWGFLGILAAGLAFAGVIGLCVVVMALAGQRAKLITTAPSHVAGVVAPPAEPDVDYAVDTPPALPSPLRPPAPAVDLALRPTIVVRALVDARGEVTRASIYRSRLELAAFEDAALDAVRGARFEPGRKDGSAVAAWVNVPVSFSDPQPPARIQIKGSDTIGGALGPDLAAAFHAGRADIEVRVEALGSATAFVGLLDGTADLGASSRSVNDKELAQATRLGLSFEEIVIGYDGIAVIVHPDSPVKELTIDQVARLFTGEIKSWKELGGADHPVRLIGRPDYSGTHGFFRDKVLRKGDSKGTAEFAPGCESIEESSKLVAAVAADPDAIAYVGVGWTTRDVRAVAIAAGAGHTAVAPSPEAILDGTYPVYRPLLMYTRGAPAGAAAAFLRFVLSPDGQALVTEHGFVASDLTADAVIPASAEDARPTPAPAPAARIEFRPGAAWLSKAAGHDLDAIARDARADRARLLVIGHADAEGGRSDNDAVALRRAEAVARRLRAHGIAGADIEVVGEGDAAPVASNTTRAGRDANRRVDVFVIP